MPSSLTASFQFTTGKHELKEQYVLYDFNAFIADIGGYLGLLLGHSLLSIYHSAYSWCQTKKDRVRAGKGAGKEKS